MSEVARTKENLEHCRCMDCPSYTLGCKVKNMPKSRCIEEDRGCLCEQCPVHAQYHLNREDYCLKTGGLTEPEAAEAYQNHIEQERLRH